MCAEFKQGESGPTLVGSVRAESINTKMEVSLRVHVRQVFFMHCGFAMISVGCVRSKFAKHIAMLILTDACASGIAWYFFG